MKPTSLNEPSVHLVCATKQPRTWSPKAGYAGNVLLGRPIFNFRSEYDKLDVYDGQAGGRR